MPEQLVTVRQIAERLAIKETKARSLCLRGPKKGGLLAFKIDGEWRSTESELDQFIELKKRTG